MERGWTRAHPFMELSTGELGRLVGEALPGARIAAAAPLTAGLRNTNYRLELTGGPSPLAIRLYTADPKACGREAAVLAAVAGRVPVPRVIYSNPAADPPYALLEWLEGETLDSVLAGCDAETARDLAAASGKTLAAIHETRFPGAGFLGPDLRVAESMPSWAGATRSALEGRAQERLGPEVAARVRRTVESEATAVERVWSDAVLVHADFKPWNLLVRRSPRGSGGDGVWHVTGVLDWEFACAGCRLIDFATFLRGDGMLPAAALDFVGAYSAAGGRVYAGWRELTGLVDLLNLLQLLAWADDRAAEDLRRLVVDTLGVA